MELAKVQIVTQEQRKTTVRIGGENKFCFQKS